MIKRAFLIAAALAAPLAAETHPADDVSAERLLADVEKLVSFGTRHTLSSQDDPARGIGASVNWGLEEFRRIGAACGDCLEVLAGWRGHHGAAAHPGADFGAQRGRHSARLRASERSGDRAGPYRQPRL
jgi:hypothetical protein